MKTLSKRIAIAGVSAVFAASLAAGAGLLTHGSTAALADSGNSTTSAYYYENLNFTTASGKQQEFTLAKQFYKALDAINESGDFKKGQVEFSLTENGLATSDQIKAWVENGDLTIPKAFSAARDSYYFDHPELFYVDLYKLTISAGRTSGVYSAYIDCGTEANCYVDNGLNSVNDVNKAIEDYNRELTLAVEYARTEAAKDTYGSAEDMLLARYANEYIAKNVKYDFDELKALGSSDKYTTPFTSNAYGALVKKLCVCSGYTFAFKAVMDELGVPCVKVNGYSISKSSDGDFNIKGDAHSWNYVWLETPSDATASAASYRDGKDGAWYAFDVTWNSNREDKNTYVNMGKFSIEKNHGTDPVVSSSGYNMPYPELSTVNYGHAPATEEFSYNYIYSSLGGTDDKGNRLMGKDEFVSYQGMGAVSLLNEGLHLVSRFAYYKEGSLVWTNWMDIGSMFVSIGFDDDGYQTKVSVANNGLYTQYAVVEIEPDLAYDPANPNHTFNREVYYSASDATSDSDEFGDHTIYISEVYTNLAFGTYTPAPYITKTTPDHTQLNFIADWMASEENPKIMADKNAITISVTYDEELHILDESKPIGISFVAEYANASKYADFVKVNSDSFVELLEDKHTLRFKFKPSLMYEHNKIMYSFYFDNVGSSKIVYNADGSSKTSDKLPNPAHYIFERTFTACNQILGGGRFWIECCAQPTLVSNSDLAAMNFTDESGESTFSEQARSQMMLVVEKTSPDVEKAMLDTAASDMQVDAGDIKSSATYDINLQMCGKVAKITDGSYVKIALGFPEGFGPEDEGVTFKIYHREHQKDGSYKIVEVPCVVTPLGIVATVTSFSPYTVVAVDTEKVGDTTKTVYATVEGKGGTLSKEDGQIKSVAVDGKCVYNFTPDSGYSIYKVTLNSKEVKQSKDITSKVVDGRLELDYADLTVNNEIVVKYISEAAAERFAGYEVDIVEPVKVVVTSSSDLYFIDDISADKNNTALIVSMCVLAVVVIAAAVVLVLVIRKRNENNVTVKATAAPKKQAASKAAAKPAPKQATKPAAPKTTATTTAAKPAAPKATATTTATAANPAASKPAATTAAPKTVTAAKPAAKPVATVKPATKPVAPKSGTTNKTTKK